MKVFEDGGFQCNYNKNEDEAFCATVDEIKAFAIAKNKNAPGNTNNYYHLLNDKIIKSFKKEKIHCEVNHKINKYFSNISFLNTNSNNNKAEHNNFCVKQSEKLKKNFLVFI